MYWTEYQTMPVALDISGLDQTSVCPRSLDPFHMVPYYIKWFKTSGTHSISEALNIFGLVT